MARRTVPAISTGSGKIKMTELSSNSTSRPPTMEKATDFPAQSWFRLHQAVQSIQPDPLWEARRPEPRAWLGFPPAWLRPHKVLPWLWRHDGGPINHNPASRTALRANLSSARSTGGALLGGLPRNQDTVTSSYTTSGSITRRVRLKLALAARRYPEATFSGAPSSPLTALLLAA